MKQLYLDSEDEITSVIQKVIGAGEERVALIPPKRSATLQSVVNMKLLQKSAREAGKEVVVITRDPNVLNIAAKIKMLAAPNLESDPSVPELPADVTLPPAVIDGSQASESDLQSADKAAGKVNDKKPKGDTTGKPKKIAKNKSVPDFNRFKKYGLLGLLAIIIIGAGIWLLGFAPRAVITVSGQTRETSADFEMRLDGEIEQADLEKNLVPGEGKEIRRTLTTTFTATGKKTIGEKATGSVEVTNCESTSSITIEKGTALTAANGMVFRATEDVTVPGSTVGGGFVCNEDGKASVPVAADKIGDDYNIGPTSYTVDGYSSSNVSGAGGNMTGGESEEVKVVTEGDVAAARKQLLQSEKGEIKAELTGQFSDSQYVIESSFKENVTDATVEPAVGGQTEEGRLILQVTYTLMAADREQLENLFSHQILEQAEDSEGLATVDAGVEAADILPAEGRNNFKVRVTGALGPDINQDEFKDELAGMKYARAIEAIEAKPNVTKAVIELSPFWVSSIPRDPEKIEIKFSIDNSAADEDDDSNRNEEDADADNTGG